MKGEQTEARVQNHDFAERHSQIRWELEQQQKQRDVKRATADTTNDSEYAANEANARRENVCC